MFSGMGIEWAATLIGCVAAVLVPIPILFYFFGARLRAKSKFAPAMDKGAAEKQEKKEEGENAV